ncbi:hypothetical protein DKX38_016186 [Salix brachista]|uniref:Uncharacterized protein n=1 Tax=Salix brachista TaxID=2182728 RepID=A0A5N5L7A0_9ROSI|nr:hypothetical protein DKX38_016186 [Salix brachista]
MKQSPCFCHSAFGKTSIPPAADSDLVKQVTTTVSIEDVHREVKYGKHHRGMRIRSNSTMLLKMKTMYMLSWSLYISYSENIDKWYSEGNVLTKEEMKPF